MMNIKEGLLLWFIDFLIKSSLRLQINLSQAVVLLTLEFNEQLAEELHKRIIRN